MTKVSPEGGQSSPGNEVLDTKDLLSLQDEKGRPLLMPGDFEHVTVKLEDCEPA